MVDRGIPRDEAAGGADLAELARAWNVELLEAQANGLVQFGRLLLTWSEKINLTAARSWEALLREHLPDAFALRSVLGGEEKLVDVGSGGGLPALPLAILAPGVRVTLVEPVAKKAAFLRTAVRECGLSGRVTVEGRRAQELVQAGMTGFDAATARAVWGPEEWSRLGIQVVRPGGVVFVLASSDPSPELPGLARTVTRSYLEDRRWLVGLRRTG